MKAVLCLLLVAGLLAASAQGLKDCPPKAGFITMSNINWNNAGGLKEGREGGSEAEAAAKAEAFCRQDKRCYAFNDAAYWMLQPPTYFAGFYAYEDMCTYVKAGKKH
ncbi:hypothetical protein OEZ85_004811 [Tetradesmus obliquus]|uniref:Uncharacterized protein n=1 Tax=Tetradesmus obliquus TaxID=3088 RepID=A0ABY8UGV9_TETOB|nr:hypothetical protein OEZ85_004811 [Tetradesmus obliquus]